MKNWSMNGGTFRTLPVPFYLWDLNKGLSIQILVLCKCCTAREGDKSLESLPKNCLLVCLTRHRNNCVIPRPVRMEKGLFVSCGLVQHIFKMMETVFIEMPEVPSAFPSQSSGVVNAHFPNLSRQQHWSTCTQACPGCQVPAEGKSRDWTWEWEFALLLGSWAQNSHRCPRPCWARQLAVRVPVPGPAHAPHAAHWVLFFISSIMFRLSLSSRVKFPLSPNSCPRVSSDQLSPGHRVP